MQKIMFLDENHMRFYKEVMDKIRDAYDGIEPDVYHKSLIYVLGLSDDCRRHLSEIFSVESSEIKPEVLCAGWQTSGSIRLVLFAFNLWNNFVPDELPDRISVSELFSGNPNLQPYLFESIRLRYPQPKLP